VGTRTNAQIKRKEQDMSILEGKKVIVIGDRDGIPGPAISLCAESAGAEVIFSATECFV
jgi:glycine reductase